MQVGTDLFSFFRYAETVGLEGSFVSEPLQKVGDKDLYTIKLRGHLYKEVKDVEVTLSTEDEEKPKDFQFKVRSFWLEYWQPSPIELYKHDTPPRFNFSCDSFMSRLISLVFENLIFNFTALTSRSLPIVGHSSMSMLFVLLMDG